MRKKENVMESSKQVVLTSLKQLLVQWTKFRDNYYKHLHDHGDADFAVLNNSIEKLEALIKEIEKTPEKSPDED